MNDLRLHIGLSIVFVLIMVAALYLTGMLGGKKSTQQEEVTLAEERFIQIAEASWGRNCESYLQKKRDKATYEELKTLPKEIKRNNILKPVSKRCNGRLECSFKVSKESTGFDPAPGCRKQAKIRYRCFMLDNLKTVELKRKGKVKIDCSKAAE